MTSLAFESMVSELTAKGIPREKAEAAARAELPDVATRLDADALRRANVLEKAEQAAVVKMARAIGFKVYTLSQPRATKQSPGLPDLWLTTESIGFAGWWETKRQVGGARSTAQEEFGQECRAAHIPYGYGDRYDFHDWLARRGFTPPTVPRDP